MAPTSTQLANRKLLAIDARELVKAHRFRPDDRCYLAETLTLECRVCAVGAVVAAGALRETAAYLTDDLERRVERLTGPERSHDYQTALMDLVGFTLEEAAAFEAAFMGHAIDLDDSALPYAQERGVDGGYATTHQLHSAPLVEAAKRWKQELVAAGLYTLRDRFFALMDLLESWEMNPVSFPTKKD
jgi:hypothetical protein